MLILNWTQSLQDSPRSFKTTTSLWTSLLSSLQRTALQAKSTEISQTDWKLNTFHLIWCYLGMRRYCIFLLRPLALTWVWYFELRVTETLAPQAQTATLATKTPHLQARSHRLFTPERPSHKHLIKSAFFNQGIFSTSLLIFDLLQSLSWCSCFEALKGWTGMLLQRAEVRSKCNTGFTHPLLKVCLAPDARELQTSFQQQLIPQGLEFRWIIKTSVLLI